MSAPAAPVILAIESSCDDTSVAVLRGRHVLSNVTAQQVIHQQYGGVFPEMAARKHQENMVPTLHLALAKAGLSLQNIQAVAFTQGPGLIGSLVIANAFAKSLSMALQVPLIATHHMKGHILAHLILDKGQKNPDFPFLALTVSGGHTQLVVVQAADNITILGETKDDAAGECLDKIGKMLGLSYPAGPIIDHLAKQGDATRFSFPLPQVPNFDFSFSGLKTAVLYFLQKETQNNGDFIAQNLHDICACVQATVVEILYQKTQSALKTTGLNQIAVGGGVAANSALRQRFQSFEAAGVGVFFPLLSYCTDNAAMIGIAAYYQFLVKDFADFSTPALPRMAY